MHKSAKEAADKSVALIQGADGWSVAGYARGGDVFLHFARSMRALEIPPYTRKGEYAADMTKAYCEQLEAQAKPLEEKAISAYAACVDAAKKSGSFDPWGRHCESRLVELRPKDFPRLAETHATDGHLAPILSTEGILSPAVP
jgi:hypothetical protein